MQSPDSPEILSELLKLLKTLTAIGAPTFHERHRSEFIQCWLRKRIDHPVEQDTLGNVWIDFSGGTGEVCLLDAHIDTVFPNETVVICQDGDHLRALGILDNTVACAMLMIWAAHFAKRGSPFLLSFTVGEEGEGNLRGIRAIVERFRPRLRRAWVFDLGLKTAALQAVGSYRTRLVWHTPGGHSWAHFGQPSAIHLMARWIARLEEAFPWQAGTHSYNIGRVRGGDGINVIASSSELSLDVRSLEPDFLQAFPNWLSQSLHLENPDIVIERTELGLRPAGKLAPDQTMLDLLQHVHSRLGLPLNFGAYSSNGNTLLAAGVPTIVTGLATGSGIHSDAEYLEISSLAPGFQKLVLLLQEPCPASA